MYLLGVTARIRYTHIWLHNTTDRSIQEECYYLTEPTYDVDTVTINCIHPMTARYVTLIRDADDLDPDYASDSPPYYLNFREIQIIGYILQNGMYK